MAKFDYDTDVMRDGAQKVLDAVAVDYPEWQLVFDTGDQELSDAIDSFHSKWGKVTEKLTAAGVEANVRVGYSADAYDEADERARVADLSAPPPIVHTGRPIKAF